MKRFQKMFFCLFLSMLYASYVFSLGGKIPFSPMKINTNLNIPDGEFLHYASYTGGEKSIDGYLVTRKEFQKDGKLYYRFYLNILPAGDSGKKIGNYKHWPVNFLVDPETGSTISSVGNIETNNNFFESRSKFGIGGLFYWSYNLDKEKSQVIYTSKTLRGEEIVTKSYRIKVNTSFPVMDGFTVGNVSFRLVDPSSPGIIYWVIPDFMKEPLPVNYRPGKKEIVRTKSGSFKTAELIMMFGDPFIGKLLEPAIRQGRILIEDSDRRFYVKKEGMGNVEILEEISNVGIQN